MVDMAARSVVVWSNRFSASSLDLPPSKIIVGCPNGLLGITKDQQQLYLKTFDAEVKKYIRKVVLDVIKDSKII